MLLYTEADLQRKDLPTGFSFEYIEDSKKFIENIKELGEQYKNDAMIHAVLKANKIDGNG